MSHLEGKDLPPGQEGTIQEPPPLPPLTLPFLHLPVDLWHHHTPGAWKGPGKESKKQFFPEVLHISAGTPWPGDGGEGGDGEAAQEQLWWDSLGMIP